MMDKSVHKRIERVYLVANENRHHGGLPGAVSFDVRKTSAYSVDEHVKHLESYEIETDSTPIQVIEDLRAFLKNNAKESADFTNAYDLPVGNEKTRSASITFAAKGSWGNETRSQLDKINNQRRKKIWKTFRVWLKKQKAY